VQVSAGGDFSCALTEAGGVKCWGANYGGHLGRGGYSSHEHAGDVPGLTEGVVSLSTNREGCAVLTTGQVKCWGQWSGPTPVPLSAPAGTVAVSQGGLHVCALVGDGRVSCWGGNDHGQVGSGAAGDRAPPTEVTSLADEVSELSLGHFYSCALLKSGTVKCWGDNRRGQLGNGTTVSSPIPVDVKGLAGEVVSITMGNHHGCALLDDGGAMCWGHNQWGQLGDGSRTDRSVPVTVESLGETPIMLSAGAYHTCALSQAGEVRCWGLNDYGQVGDGTREPRPIPQGVWPLGSDVVSVSAGSNHSCAVMRNGGVQCWGYEEGSYERYTFGPRRRTSPEWVLGE
jgi:alpha-tubulin suppressor-like RCC1 family protein